MFFAQSNYVAAQRQTRKVFVMRRFIVILSVMIFKFLASIVSIQTV